MSIEYPLPFIKITRPEPGDKLQMGYKSIMLTDKWVGEGESELTSSECISSHFNWSLIILKKHFNSVDSKISYSDHDWQYFSQLHIKTCFFLLCFIATLNGIYCWDIRRPEKPSAVQMVLLMVSFQSWWQ